MAKINISFRVKPNHYQSIKEEIRKGRTLTGLFEELLDKEFPSSGFFRT